MLLVIDSRTGNKGKINGTWICVEYFSGSNYVFLLWLEKFIWNTYYSRLEIDKWLLWICGWTIFISFLWLWTACIEGTWIARPQSRQKKQQEPKTIAVFSAHGCGFGVLQTFKSNRKSLSMTKVPVTGLLLTVMGRIVKNLITRTILGIILCSLVDQLKYTEFWALFWVCIWSINSPAREATMTGRQTVDDLSDPPCQDCIQCSGCDQTLLLTICVVLWRARLDRQARVAATDNNTKGISK